MNVRSTKRVHILAALLSCAVCSALPAAAADFSFGVVSANALRTPTESVLRTVLDDSDSDNLAFVSVIGIKSAGEECSDVLVRKRKDLIDNAKNGIVVVPAANDWSACRNAGSGVSALERLTRLREWFFYDEFSLGQSRIPVARQSSTVKFRAYAENMRWEIDRIMFATLNLPANNNNFRTEAGRNAEYEDRAVANREWLRRIFGFASRATSRAIVIFCDADPWATAAGTGVRRDGYADMRTLLESLSAKFAGKVLVIPGGAVRNGGSIGWHKNIGVLNPSSAWTRITADLASPDIFSAKAMSLGTTGER